MIELDTIDPNAIIRFGGGEPTIIPEFEELVNYFIDMKRRFWMNTSGVRSMPFFTGCPADRSPWTSMCQASPS